MREHATPAHAPGTEHRRPAGADTDDAGISALQRTAGNAAVSRMLDPGGPSRRDQILGVVQSGGGRPLDSSMRNRMESHLGADLSGVRVHTGPKAEASAASVDAAAYTTGDNIVLGKGLSPSSPSTQHVLAHELAHVVQQRSGPVDGTVTSDGLKISDPSDRHERAAEASASEALS